MLVSVTNNGLTFLCTPAQAHALELLGNTNGGGFATVKGYVSESNRVKPETADITFLSRFSTENLYKRKRDALEALTLNDIMSDIRDNPKVKALTVDALDKAFAERKASELASIDKSLQEWSTGQIDESDNRRAAHRSNYHTFAPGVKVNFVSAKGDDGLTAPVLTDGKPVVDSIMLSAIQVSKRVTVEGEYKVVNSGVPVLISNAFKKHLPKSAKLKTISLKEGKFEALNVASLTILPEAFKGL